MYIIIMGSNNVTVIKSDSNGHVSTYSHPTLSLAFELIAFMESVEVDYIDNHCKKIYDRIPAVYMVEV